MAGPFSRAARPTRQSPFSRTSRQRKFSPFSKLSSPQNKELESQGLLNIGEPITNEPPTTVPAVSIPEGPIPLSKSQIIDKYTKEGYILDGDRLIKNDTYWKGDTKKTIPYDIINLNDNGIVRRSLYKYNNKGQAKYAKTWDYINGKYEYKSFRGSGNKDKAYFSYDPYTDKINMGEKQKIRPKDNISPADKLNQELQSTDKQRAKEGLAPLNEVLKYSNLPKELRDVFTSPDFTNLNKERVKAGLPPLSVAINPEYQAAVKQNRLDQERMDWINKHIQQDIVDRHETIDGRYEINPSGGYLDTWNEQSVPQTLGQSKGISLSYKDNYYGGYHQPLTAEEIRQQNLKIAEQFEREIMNKQYNPMIMDAFTYRDEYGNPYKVNEEMTAKMLYGSQKSDPTAPGMRDYNYYQENIKDSYTNYKKEFYDDFNKDKSKAQALIEHIYDYNSPNVDFKKMKPTSQDVLIKASTGKELTPIENAQIRTDPEAMKYLRELGAFNETEAQKNLAKITPTLGQGPFLYELSKSPQVWNELYGGESQYTKKIPYLPEDWWLTEKLQKGSNILSNWRAEKDEAKEARDEIWTQIKDPQNLAAMGAYTVGTGVLDYGTTAITGSPIGLGDAVDWAYAAPDLARGFLIPTPMNRAIAMVEMADIAVDFAIPWSGLHINTKTFVNGRPLIYYHKGFGNSKLDNNWAIKGDDKVIVEGPLKKLAQNKSNNFANQIIKRLTDKAGGTQYITFQGTEAKGKYNSFLTVGSDGSFVHIKEKSKSPGNYEIISQKGGSDIAEYKHYKNGYELHSETKKNPLQLSDSMLNVKEIHKMESTPTNRRDGLALINEKRKTNRALLEWNIRMNKKQALRGEGGQISETTVATKRFPETTQDFNEQFTLVADPTKIDYGWDISQLTPEQYMFMTHEKTPLTSYQNKLQNTKWKKGKQLSNVKEPGMYSQSFMFDNDGTTYDVKPDEELMWGYTTPMYPENYMSYSATRGNPMFKKSGKSSLTFVPDNRMAIKKHIRVAGDTRVVTEKPPKKKIGKRKAFKKMMTQSKRGSNVNNQVLVPLELNTHIAPESNFEFSPDEFKYKNGDLTHFNIMNNADFKRKSNIKTQHNIKPEIGNEIKTENEGGNDLKDEFEMDMTNVIDNANKIEIQNKINNKQKQQQKSQIDIDYKQDLDTDIDLVEDLDQDIDGNINVNMNLNTNAKSNTRIKKKKPKNKLDTHEIEVFQNGKFRPIGLRYKTQLEAEQALQNILDIVEESKGRTRASDKVPNAKKPIKIQNKFKFDIKKRPKASIVIEKKKFRTDHSSELLRKGIKRDGNFKRARYF